MPAVSGDRRPIRAEPASGFAEAARRAGARLIAFDPGPSSEPRRFDEHIAGPLAETVPAYVKRLIAETVECWPPRLLSSLRSSQ